MSESTPLVSCLCVTEGREAFMPWLLWNFDRQDWPRAELVVVDSSPSPLRVDRDDVRVITEAPGTGVACKRNRALREAAGEIVVWFDDDDWQHPARLSRLVEALRTATVAGPRVAWFLDLAASRVREYRGSRDQLLFNGSGFRTGAARQVAFPEHVRRASDGHWMRGLRSRHRGRSLRILDDEALFFWLSHAGNLSNPARKRRCQRPVSDLRAVVGEEAWADTDEALAQLRRDLGRSATGAPRTPGDDASALVPPVTAARRRRRDARAQPAQAPGADNPSQANLPQANPPAVGSTPIGMPRVDMPPAGPTPVGLLLKATVLDAPYLDVMARHMVDQARYPFAERVVVVDRPRAFSGKYRVRPGAGDGTGALKAVLDGLVTDGVIDAWRYVDYDADKVAAVLDRYFPGQGPRVSTHASTGGPIYATLFGMEGMACDHVLQMDADVFFHTDGSSWVEDALRVLAADERIWLMMTHPGPPAGPAGRSLGPRNAARARWDAGAGLWRFQTATTRYFLCDRRNLRGRLVPRIRRGLCEPLELCISRALQAHGAFRGALGHLRSWHLHAWSHQAPFAQWAPLLAQAVADGRYPDRQAGDYDLRLDREADRAAWQALLESVPERRGGAPPREAASGERVAAREPDRRPRRAGGTAPTLAASAADAVSVVIPIRDRAVEPVRNAVRSLFWQTAGAPGEVILVSHGSSEDCNRALRSMCEQEGARLLIEGRPGEPWNKCQALNAGIRASREDSRVVMTMDADIVLACNFFDTALAAGDGLILCRCSDLPRAARLPRSARDWLKQYAALLRTTRKRPSTSSGGIQWAPRAFWFGVQGYDEDLSWWGAMDNDIVRRARLEGLAVRWIDDRTSILHQWHPRKTAVLTRAEDRTAAASAWRRNHELMRERAGTAVRNGARWGGLPA